MIGTFTNFLLAKIGLIPSDLCTFCNSFPETIDHLFFECFYSSKFWEQFESYFNLLVFVILRATGNSFKNCLTWCD